MAAERAGEQRGREWVGELGGREGRACEEEDVVVVVVEQYEQQQEEEQQDEEQEAGGGDRDTKRERQKTQRAKDDGTRTSGRGRRCAAQG